MAKPKKLKNTFHWHLGGIICNMRWVMIVKIIVEMGIIQSRTLMLSIILFFKPCKLLNSQYKDIGIYAWKFRLYQIFANVNISMIMSKKIDMFLLLQLMRGINTHNKRDVSIIAVLMFSKRPIGFIVHFSVKTQKEAIPLFVLKKDELRICTSTVVSFIYFLI